MEGGDRLEQVGVTQQGRGVLFVVTGAGETGDITGLAATGEVVGIDSEGGGREKTGGPADDGFVHPRTPVGIGVAALIGARQPVQPGASARAQ